MYQSVFSIVDAYDLEWYITTTAISIKPGTAVALSTLMVCESDHPRTRYYRIHSGRMYCSVLSVVLLSSLLCPEPTSLIWAAVYECVDAGGKPLLTNKPAQLHNCHMLSENPIPELAPAEASTSPQESPSPRNADAPEVPYMHSNPPTPCARGVNPLNPLSNPPCTQPPDVVPTPAP